MVKLNFLDTHLSANILSRFAYGVSREFFTPILVASIGLLALCTGFATLNHHIQARESILNALHEQNSQLHQRLGKERLSLERLTELVAVDEAIVRAHRSGVFVTNAHVHLANTLDSHTALMAIENDSNPTNITGVAQSISAVGVTLHALANEFGASNVLLQSVHHVSNATGIDAVQFEVRLVHDVVCCRAKK